MLCMFFLLTSIQSPLQPIPGSPTSPVSVLGGSNSTLSGSASSGVSSLSESVHSHAETPSRNENAILNRHDNPIENAQLHYWSPDDHLSSHYPHVHFSSVPEHMPYPSAPKHAQYGQGHYGAYSADSEPVEPHRLCHLRPAGFSAIQEQYHHHQHLHGSLRQAGTPAVPPKPAQREEEGAVPHPVPLPRRIFPPHRVTWEQGIREEQEENAGWRQKKTMAEGGSNRKVHQSATIFNHVLSWTACVGYPGVRRLCVDVSSL